ncbi:MAG: FAD-dependent oxidoreductase [Thermoanaerobaculia bacterium]|nr:FAD-dependent oxidoreductase [Thermoanaerobaculia bacterium]
MRPSRREAIAALVGLPALSSFLAACRRSPDGPAFSGAIVGADVLRGHRIRTGELLSRPVARRESVGVAILGAGISGLTAAWTLARAGFTDFRIYELEDEPGGNARSGANAVSAFPWGAHYVPVPLYGNPALETLLDEVGAVAGRSADGTPEWAEEMLCGEPEERLFFRGLWYEGLYPRAGASREDREELSRFEREMHRFARLRDAKGRRAFALPRRLSSDDAEWTALDRISMREWLTRSGFRGARLFWFAEYATRDDFGSSLDDASAWAGIHYFASRLRGTAPDEPFEEPASFLTWPEGNGRLVKHLVTAAGGRIVTAAVVFDVVPRSGGATLRWLDAPRNEVVEVAARHVVYALPRYTAAKVLAPWRESPPAFLRAFEYAPWLVANLTLSGRPADRGFPLCWDNVLYDSRGLGYVVATHQGGRSHGPTVLTYYLVFAGEEPRKAREKLLSATWKELAEAVLADLSRAHPDLPSLVTNVDVHLWGHAMARPHPGFVWHPDREALERPVGRVRFAHADASGLPLFEEAQDAGVRSAESILAEEGERFRTLLG